MWSDWFSLNYKVVCSNSDLKKNRRCTCLDSIFSPAAQHEPTAPSIITDRSGRFAFAPPTFCGTGDRSIISVRWVWRIYCSNQIEKINNCIYGCMIAVLWCLWYPFASVNDPFLFFASGVVCLLIGWVQRHQVDWPFFPLTEFPERKIQMYWSFSRKKCFSLACEYLFNLVNTRCTDCKCFSRLI